MKMTAGKDIMSGGIIIMSADNIIMTIDNFNLSKGIIIMTSDIIILKAVIKIMFTVNIIMTAGIIVMPKGIMSLTNRKWLFDLQFPAPLARTAPTARQHISLGWSEAKAWVYAKGTHQGLKARRKAAR